MTDQAATGPEEGPSTAEVMQLLRDSGLSWWSLISGVLAVLLAAAVAFGLVLLGLGLAVRIALEPFAGRQTVVEVAVGVSIVMSLSVGGAVIYNRILAKRVRELRGKVAELQRANDAAGAELEKLRGG